MFLDTANKNPTGVAIRHDGIEYSYRELETKSSLIAASLRSIYVSSGDIIGVYMERNVDMIAAIFAILRIGCVYLPLDVRYPIERTARIQHSARPKLIITDDTNSCVLQNNGLTNIYSLNTNSLTDVLTDEQSRNYIAPDSLAYIMYTSGSTGSPKGVCIEHRSVENLIAWAKTVYSKRELSTVLFSTSVCFDISIFELFVPLCTGGSVVIARDAIDLIFEDLNGVTLINSVPTVMDVVCNSTCLPSSVTTVNLAGEELGINLVESLYENKGLERIFNLYGPTENTIYSTACELIRGQTTKPLIGRPIRNTNIYILDGDLSPVCDGEKGEIYLSGHGLARGYLNDITLTDDAFIELRINENLVRCYKTGDMGRISHSGEIEYLGRTDSQVKIRGHRVEMMEVEYHIRALDNIKNAIVVTRNGADGHKYLAAFVIGKKETICAKTIRSQLATTLPNYMVPQTFTIMDSFPRTASGKADRIALAEM